MPHIIHHFLLLLLLVTGPTARTGLQAQEDTLRADNNVFPVEEQVDSLPSILAVINELHRTGKGARLAVYLDSLAEEETLATEDLLNFQLSLSVLLLESGNLGRALEVSHAVISRAASAKLPGLQAEAMQNINYCYTYAGLEEKAERWLQIANDFIREHDLVEARLLQLVNYGYKYLHAGKFEASRRSFEELLTLVGTDTIQNYYAFGHAGILEVYVTSGEGFSPAGLEALRVAKKLSRRATPFSSPHGKRNLIGTISKYYTLTNQPQEALKYARRHVDHVRKSAPDTAEIVRFALNELHAAEFDAGAFEEAYKTLSKLREIERFRSEQKQIGALATASVELDLETNNLARLKAEKAALLEENAKNSRTRWLLIVALLASIVIIIVAFAYWRARLDRDMIAEKNELANRSLAEKEVLLREIHHRVKNNLQIISSLLQKQARLSGDENFRRFVRDGQDRIQSMALIHQKLYRSTELEGIDVRAYLEELGAHISRSQGSGAEGIALNLRADDTQLDIDTAVPLGLILNELITNAFKYAFPDGREGSIIVEFSRRAGKALLRVSDNGVGLPEGWVPRQSDTLGVNLVTGLVQQLGGGVEWVSEGMGTIIVITF